MLLLISNKILYNYFYKTYMFHWKEERNIFDLGALKDNEYIIFLNRTSDILGNFQYTEFVIHKNENGSLVLEFEKNISTNKKYHASSIVDTIQTVKQSSAGVIALPNIICENEAIEGSYRDGFKFEFKEVVNIRLVKERFA